MEVLNAQDIAKEQDRLSAVMATCTRIVRDTYTIKPQRDTIKHNMDVKTARLKVLSDLMVLPCADCQHMRTDHASRGKCYAAGCKCDMWVVIDES